MKLKKIGIRKKKLKNKSSGPNPFVPKLKQVGSANKKAISIRLDENIIDWFKENHPDGYQSAINQVLSEHVADNG